MLPEGRSAATGTSVSRASIPAERVCISSPSPEGVSLGRNCHVTAPAASSTKAVASAAMDFHAGLRGDRSSAAFSLILASMAGVASSPPS